MTDLSGLQVACPQCRRTYFTTTSKFDPTKPPTGNMVYPIVKYSIDWLCSSTTKASEMTCPECLGQLAHTGCLLVRVPIDRIMDVYRALYPEDGHGENSQSGGSGKKYVCEVCGKEAKSQLGLNSHMRSHGGNNV
jgi:hypothetical protein